MNKFFLKLAMLPAPLWRSLGADADQLSTILNMRLMIDDRRPLVLGRRQTKAKEIKNGTVTSFLLFTLMGCFYALPLLFIDNRIVSLTVYLFIMFLMLTLTLITDYSNVLFDNRDKFTLFPRPINDRTLVLSKLLHVFIYLLRMVLPISLGGWCVLGYMDGWTSVVLFPLPVLLLVFMSLFLVNSVYLLILKLAKPERFKDIISYFQVVASIFFFAIVYLRPNNINLHLNDITAERFYWVKYLPFYWWASFWSWLGQPMLLGGGSWMGIAGFALPVLCMMVLVRWLAPEFTRRIAGIDSAEVSEFSVSATRTRRPRKTAQVLANIFNRSDAAKAGFMLAWLQTTRSRTFRMRVYPSMAFIPIYFIYILTMNGQSYTQAFADLPGTSKHLFLLYMTSYVLINGLNYMIMSDQYKAAWVYYSAPIQTPGHIMLGAFKAMCVKLFLPFFTVIALFVIYLWGPDVLPDVLLAMVNVLLLSITMARIAFRQLPFSSMEQLKQSAGKVIKSLITMLVPFVLGICHYFSMPLWWLKLTFTFLSVAMLWLVVESYKDTSWAVIKKEEA